MSTTFEKAGFNTSAINKINTTNLTQKAPTEQTLSAKTNAIKEKNDEFVSQDELKAQIKEELLQEMQQENLQSEEKPEKKGFVQKTNSAIANFQKGVVTIKEVAKGLAKGVAKGAIAGGVGFGILGLVGKVKKQKPILKNKLAIALGAVIAAGSIFIELWKAGLNANQQKANIEHKYIKNPHNT